MSKRKGKTYRSALIPLRYSDNQLEIMLMRPSDTRFGGSLFQLCKGKIDPGESSIIAAIREGEEELGIRGKDIRCLVFLGTFLSRTSVYLCTLDATSKFLPTCSETAETTWMTIPQFLAVGRPLHFPIVQELNRVSLSGYNIQLL